MAALVSCQENEIRNDDLIVKDGDIVFRMNGNGRATKSMDSAAPMKGVTIDLGAESGTRFFLEETIVNLDDIVLGPQTKGTPAYTENLGQLYADNLGVSAVGGNFGDIAYENAENEIGDDGKWLFKHHYTSDPWPDEETPVDFYLRMPASPAGVTLGGKANGSITFTYASPNTATATQDILFGYRSLAKKDYPKTGIPAVLYHALTGVKFAIGNDDDDISDNNIAITEVIFEGLYDSGTCVVTPAEDGSTASADAVEWKSPSSREDFTISSGSLLADGAQQIADYSESDYTFPASFSSAGITNNMNDNNASKTFWLIPQAFEGRDDVMLTIKYNYGDKTGIETKLMLGEIFGKRGIEWKAGELHTYNIRIAEVNLQIDDQVTMSQAFITSNDWKDAEGSTKHDVVITNTGNTPAFIRAAIVGQWIDEVGDDLPPTRAHVDEKGIVK